MLSLPVPLRLCLEWMGWQFVKLKKRSKEKRESKPWGFVVYLQYFIPEVATSARLPVESWKLGLESEVNWSVELAWHNNTHTSRRSQPGPGVQVNLDKWPGNYFPLLLLRNKTRTRAPFIFIPSLELTGMLSWNWNRLEWKDIAVAIPLHYAMGWHFTSLHFRLAFQISFQKCFQFQFCYAILAFQRLGMEMGGYKETVLCWILQDRTSANWTWRV